MQFRYLAWYKDETKTLGYQKKKKKKDFKGSLSYLLYSVKVYD